MGKAVLVALIASLALVGCQGADKVLECNKRTCVSAASDAVLELSCGGTGEVLEVVFASFGQPTGTCPDVNGEEFNSTALNLVATAGCDASTSLAKLQELCDGKDECSVKVGEAFTGTEGGLGSCAAGQRELLVYATCSNAFDLFTILLALVIAVIGLALGASIEVHQFKTIMAEHKRAVLIGFACQYGFMPLIAFTMVKIFDFDPAVALGVILVGSAPGGTTSNLVTYWAKGSVALSITMSAASTVCALFMLPILVIIYVDTALGVEESISIPFTDIAQTLAIAVLPASLGVFIRSRNAAIAKKVEIFGTILGGFFILAALVLGVIQNPALFVGADYPYGWTAAMLLQPTGGLLGYGIASLAKLPRPERRAVCIETGIQNTPLVIAMIALSFVGCTRVAILTFPLLASFTLLVNSAWMALFLRYLSRFDTDEDKELLAHEQEDADRFNNKVAAAPL